MANVFASLPLPHQEVLRAALDAALGGLRVQSISPVVGGASGAFPYVVQLGGRRVLARVEGAASPLRNPHQYESMQIAAEAGIAPPLHFVSEKHRVAVMDFIDERPLSTFPGGSRALARAVGLLLRRVRETPTFPRFVDYPEMVGRLWWWVCQMGLFAPGVLDPVSERLDEIRRTYVLDVAGSVSSHNDPVPRNVLFDGHRLWLIDWESAYRNDPLVDLAIALDNIVDSPGAEQAVLEGWHGQESPPASPTDRLDQVRALTRLYYAGVLLSASAATQGSLEDRDLTAPSITHLQALLRTGEISAGSPKAKHTLGKMYLASFLTGERPPGLHAAV